MKHTLFIFLLIIFFGSNLFARSFRVSQIPNGAKFNCGNCHVSSNSGGARNDFGADVFSFLDVQNSSGNVQWGSALAVLDSDDDDVTNGVELLDPDGSWSIGQANPGNTDDVTNPGDASSVSAIPVHSTLPNEFALEQNFPNPFNPSTRIDFTLPRAEYVELKVFNVLGKEVATLISDNLAQGNHTHTFNANNLAGGVYYYQISAGAYQDVKKMILLR
jgi:hypothetical protein